MAVKVFLGLPTFNGYVGAPADHFTIEMSLQMFNSDGPQAESDSLALDIPLSATPPQVYGLAYAAVCGKVAGLLWPTPTKEDVFGFLPTPISVVLPDLPSLA